jgi:hypothetical protein
MWIGIHLTLLGSVAAATIVSVIRGYGQGPRRSLPRIVLSLVPFFIVALCCASLLSINGAPTIEWALPTAAVIVVNLIHPPRCLFRIIYWFLLGMCLSLCISFIFLVQVQEEFTTNPALVEQISSLRERIAKQEGRAALQKLYGLEVVFEPAPVWKLLNDANVRNIEVLTVDEEWHTLLTRLYRVSRKPGLLWYPGGTLRRGCERLELRVEE